MAAKISVVTWSAHDAELVILAFCGRHRNQQTHVLSKCVELPFAIYSAGTTANLHIGFWISEGFIQA